MRKSSWVIIVISLWHTTLCWSQQRPTDVPAATNQFLLTPASSRLEIESKLQSMQKQADALHREERVLQGDIERIDAGVRDYLKATNSITDPDVLALKKQMDEVESKYRALNSALTMKLQELPQFRGHFEMKRAAFYRLRQIELKISELNQGQKILQDRIEVLNPPSTKP
jgi:hypothetical protein